ncbi:ankyrin repeat domain-containing protein [Rahnella sp. PD12R]|uniref:ankyrin repeat domain-containing protein n=1 Tax=Rahnella sp. PD12R TaxID=2855688 RepID=UPI001C467FFF|nr:ankyrin repeat domain-containing protein [Rahnella sp. PD12R]MBV6821117.1 ankyrin repeat domain-containing protein [Rahnella sp. PD12R]
MSAELTLKTLFLVALLLIGCDDHERNFYISPLASSPVTLNSLKARWNFCETCLSNNECKAEDVRQCKTVMIPDMKNALDAAVRGANADAVYFLVDEAKTDVNGVSDSYNGTPLMTAAYYGTKEHQKIAAFLISRGANVNATRKSPPIDTALLIAIWKNNTKFAMFLLENGADPSLTYAGEKEGNACMRALIKNNMELVSRIPGCCSFIATKNAQFSNGVNKCR